MGYAEASGLPAICGLYATIAPLLAYALFGPSRILVLGPDSGLAALIAAAVVSSSAGNPERAVALGSLLAILTGLLCIGAGLLRAGALTDLLSKPVRVGYMNGIALIIVVTQLPKLCGFSVQATHVGSGAIAFARGLVAGQVKPWALAIGAGCLVVIFGARAVSAKIPGILIAVVLATLTVWLFHLSGHLSVVGAVPRGLPVPSLPAVTLADVGNLALAAVGIALVAFADTSVLSRTFAARDGALVDPNRELTGLGLANLAAGFFHGFPISSSASRTPVASSAGSQTQVTGVVGAVAIAILLVAAPGLLVQLPTAALAAVVITGALGLFELRALQVFFRVRRSDFVLSMIAFAAVAVLGVVPGIAIAVGVSILDFVRRAWRPHHAILGRADGVKGYHDIQRYPDAKQIPGLLLYRWDAPLFFANAEMFRRSVVAAVTASAVPIKWVVVAAEPITDVDTTAAEKIEELDKELAAREIELAFAELKDPVKDRLSRYGLHTQIGREFFFPTLGVAVKAFLDRHPTTWVDWEESPPAPTR